MRQMTTFALAVILSSALFSAGAALRVTDGSHDMHGHAAATCAGSACTSSPEPVAPAVDCIAHCLKASATAVTETAPTVAALVVAIAAAAVAGRRLAQELSSPAATDAVAALVRKRSVATIVLRN